jgi:nicotinate-nucleotide pyrophosphorylase (carboxylating)
MTQHLPDDIAATVSTALAEDVGGGDLTAALVEPGARADARVVCREDAVLCGSAWFTEVFRQLDNAIEIVWKKHDGERIGFEETVCSLKGPARPMLTGERTALNFLQMLSATATQAHRFAAAVAGTSAVILDTRKTIPGLRNAQKYAVRCGGARNHRQGLFDAILIKENHLAAAGGVEAAIEKARAAAPGVSIETEVETLAQVDEGIRARADRILLDNFSLDTMRAAVAQVAGRAELEASGSIDLEQVRAVAETGVDFISIGAITKHIRAIDFSMRFDLGGHSV